jgi:hypothetical protein
MAAKNPFELPVIRHNWCELLGNQLYNKKTDSPKLAKMNLHVYAGLRVSLLRHVDTLVLEAPFVVDNTASDDLAFMDCIMIYMQASLNYTALVSASRNIAAGTAKTIHQDWKRVHGMIRYILDSEWYKKQDDGELPPCLQKSRLERISNLVYAWTIKVGICNVSGINYTERKSVAAAMRVLRSVDATARAAVGGDSVYHFLCAALCYHKFVENTVKNTSAHACYCCHRSLVGTFDLELQRQLAGMNQIFESILGYSDRRHVAGETCIFIDKESEPLIPRPEMYTTPFDFSAYEPHDPIQIVAK